MGTVFTALLTSKLLWKRQPRVALEDYVLVRDSSQSQLWPRLVRGVSFNHCFGIS